jgi:hypothetical protein
MVNGHLSNIALALLPKMGYPAHQDVVFQTQRLMGVIAASIVGVVG